MFGGCNPALTLIQDLVDRALTNKAPVNYLVPAALHALLAVVEISRFLLRLRPCDVALHTLCDLSQKRCGVENVNTCMQELFVMYRP